MRFFFLLEGAQLMPDSVLLVFEMIGTVAFSVSGAMTGVKKGMDAFGVIILGLVTAVGGGVIRRFCACWKETTGCMSLSFL